MSYKRINNLTGWAICLIACTVYIMTMEATGSLWDCGEFASSAYKLQIPHPPGAPLFVLIARLFMAPFDPAHAATGINLMSALASGFTILFLFWSITHFAKKLVMKDGQPLDQGKIIGIMAAGAVGALAYTFSDSFWYSAVEGEVYAMSSFFTGLVFWCMVKWEQNVMAEEEVGITGHFTKADRWLILIFYLMGLSIGVHLLNLLTIPAIVMMYYYKRYTVTPWKTFFAFVTGCVLTGVVQKAVIVWTIKAAGNLDIIFKNDFGMPFFSGFIFFFVMIAALVYFGIRLAIRKNWNFLKLGLWSFIFMLMGYSTYFTTMVRSLADPSVDMYNVDNPVNLVGYVSREQYGDWPILYGQDFTAGNVQGNDYRPDYTNEDVYIKSGNSYEKKGKKQTVTYHPEDLHFFPRMWDQSNDQQHANYYADFADIHQDKQGLWDRAPTVKENIDFFVQYQVGWMYWRYFMWNFAGKQNDIEGTQMSDVRDGNWKTGISFYDNWRLGDQSAMPDSMKNNKANNKLFMFPFILGIIGLIYQIKKDKRDALIVGLLFFFTGFAICIYLNQAGNQPRERDYAYVGSFYAFAFWIGLGVLYVKEWLNSALKNGRNAAVLSGLICTLAVPVIMANQEWDDHDRSQKTTARDLAIDYLESCAPNAILISFGDNDTYPLWYAQEVQGIRTDVRVINSSLLGTDWYINQLRYKVNQSDPIDAIWSAEQIEGNTRDQIIYNPQALGADPSKPMDLFTMMKDYVGSDDPKYMVGNEERYNTFPTKKVTVPVDTALVRQNGTVNANDHNISDTLQFEIPKNYLFKNDAAILNIIAANKWKRPIYFTSPYDELGFRNYLRQDGLTYRLVPISNSNPSGEMNVNRDWVVDKMMHNFAFGSAEKKGVYFDEENRRHLNTIRLAYAEAASNLADAGRKEEAKQMLNKCDKMMLESNFPYGSVSRGQSHNQISLQFLVAAYKAGDSALIKKVTESVQKDMEQQVTYYSALSEDQRQALGDEITRNDRFLKGLRDLPAQFAAQARLSENPLPIQTQGVSPAKKDSPKH